MTERAMTNEYDLRSETLWASIDEYDEEAFRAKIEELVADQDQLDEAVSAFLALALVDSGREREAVSVALAALAPHASIRPAAAEHGGSRDGSPQ